MLAARTSVLRHAKLQLLQDSSPLSQALEHAGFGNVRLIFTASLHNCLQDHTSADFAKGQSFRGMRWPVQQTDALIAQPSRRRKCVCKTCSMALSNSTAWLHTDAAVQEAEPAVPAKRTSTPEPSGQTIDSYVYVGPLSKTLRRLKMLSVFSCGFTMFGSPLIVEMGSAATSFGGKAAIAVGLCSFGVFTTGLLHWFTGPYVHRLDYDASAKTMTIETLSLFARPQHHTVRLDEIQYPDTMRPQVTFQAQQSLFYVDADNFQDKELLSQLSLPDPANVSSTQS